MDGWNLRITHLMQSIARIFAGIDLKFSNMCLLGTGENVQPYPAGAYGSKAVDLLVPDCLAGRYALPAVVRPYLDRVFFDVLAIVEPFHRSNPVHGGLFGEVDLECGMVRTRRG